jgi:2-polyprenyl-3-methyl-5-hydroxy-6-metoxy-1,4-benzoquinol methylase
MRDIVNGTVYGFPPQSGMDAEDNTAKMLEDWSLHIKDQSWVEDTEKQVDFIIQTLRLTGHERILDMACGFGRHSLSFARRGFSVLGVDFTQAYIDDAKKEAQKQALTNAKFLLSDIRDIDFRNEFDVVLNLADGAIGYSETDEENLIVFDKIAQALKPGGKHFMDVCNAEHAEQFFPKRHWQIGSKILALPEFDWDRERRRMIYGGWEITFGEVAQKPVPMGRGGGARLYSPRELEEILRKRGMEIARTFSDYHGKPATPKEMQLMVYSTKRA